MALPSVFNRRTVYDDFIDLNGDPVLGKVKFAAHVKRWTREDGPTIVPIEITVPIEQTTIIFRGKDADGNDLPEESLSTGRFTVDLPLSVDPDIVQDDTYTVTVFLTSPTGGKDVPQPSFDISLTDGPPVRLKNLAPAGPVLNVAAYLTDTEATQKFADRQTVNAQLAQKADTTAIAAKADKTYVDAGLATKADVLALAAKADVSAITGKADKSYVDTGLASKADASAASNATNLSSGTLSPLRIADGSLAKAKLDTTIQASLAAADAAAPASSVTPKADKSYVDTQLAGKADVTTAANATNLTAGTLAVARIADGSLSSAKLDATTRTSLGKADTALQGVADGSLSKAKLDTTVQASLGKADTALQSAPVTTVAGRSGAVVLTKTDVGLSNVSNTSDLAKPISTLTQAALDAKVNSDTFDATVASLQDSIATIGSTPNPTQMYPVYYDTTNGWPTVSASILALPVLWVGGTTMPPQGRWTGTWAHVWLKADGAIVTYAAQYGFESYATGANQDATIQANGQQWDVVSSTATGVSATVVATPVYGGTKAGKFTAGSTAAQVWAGFRGRGSLTESTFSAMYYLTAYPTANCTLLRRRIQTSPGVYGSASGVRMTPTGLLDFMDSSFNVMFSTTQAVPLNTWFVIEDHRIASATAANCRANGWVQWVGGPVITVGDDTTVRAVGATLDENTVGILSNQTNYSVIVDEVRLGASGRQFGTL